VSVTVERNAAPIDVTDSAVILASERRTIGAGNPDLEVIRDGTRPAIDATDWALQYTSFTGRIAAQGFIGYQLSSPRALAQLQFQAGIQFPNGGWFDLLDVQVLRANVWRSVEGLSISPSYPGASGASWQSYSLRFTPVVAEAIRLGGVPGGSATFFSVAELRALTP
jgi:hypothetical protein